MQFKRQVGEFVGRMQKEYGIDSAVILLGKTLDPEARTFDSYAKYMGEKGTVDVMIASAAKHVIDNDLKLMNLT